MKHYVVALDEFGRTICEVDISPAGRGPVYETDNHERAMKESGRRTVLLEQRQRWMHPRNRRNEASVKVAGYEVVSWEEDEDEMETR